VRARSYHSTPWRGHECRRLRTRLVDEMCKNAQMRCDAKDTPRGRMTATPRATSQNALGSICCEKIRTGLRPDSYPHVTCEGTAIRLRLQGVLVVGAAAPKAR
jgi:hypothetical protein